MFDKKAKFCNISFFSKQSSSLLKQVEASLTNSRKTSYITTPNPEIITQAWQNHELLGYLQRSDIALADGVGVIVAFRLLRLLGSDAAQGPVPQRITGVDFVEMLLRRIREHSEFAQDRVVLVGGRNYAATAPAKLVLHGITIHWHPGYRDVSNPTAAEEDELRAYLREKDPTVVFVAFGAPYQERWMFSHSDLFDKLDTRIVMAVGGTFDYLMGLVSRAPGWMRAVGLEWIYRLYQQPWRWRRQLRLFGFMGLVVWAAVSKRSPLPDVSDRSLDQ